MIPGLGMGAWNGAAVGEIDLYSILKSLDLADGLITCLDAGSEKSFDGGKLWKDLSANGGNFWRGPSSAVHANDPTFRGTVGGLSENEYFTFDGEDYFQEAQANWGDDDLDTSNIQSSMISIACPATYTNNQNTPFIFFSNRSSAATATGAGSSYGVMHTDYQMRVASVTNATITSTNVRSGAIPTTGMHFFGLNSLWSGTAPRPHTTDFVFNGNASTVVNNRSNTRTANATTAAMIGRYGFSGSYLPSAPNSKLWLLALWKGRKVSTDEMLSVRAALKDLRFPQLPNS